MMRYLWGPKRKRKKMKIDIDKVASLSRLKLEDSKKQEVEKQLEGILEFFTQLQAVDTQGVEPLITPHDTLPIFREDQALQDDDFVESTLKQAPEVKGRLIKVPPVVGGES